MKQSFEEYVEGRMMIGGCLMWIFGIVIAFALIIVCVANFFGDLNVFKLIGLILFIVFTVWICWDKFKK